MLMRVFLVFVALMFFFGSCTQTTIYGTPAPIEEQPVLVGPPICNDPYILHNNMCCLDANKNNVCDDLEPTPRSVNIAKPVPPGPAIQPLPELSEKVLADVLARHQRNYVGYGYKLYLGQKIKPHVRVARGDKVLLYYYRDFVEFGNSNKFNYVIIDHKEQTVQAYCKYAKGCGKTPFGSPYTPTTIDYELANEPSIFDYFNTWRNIGVVRIDSGALVSNYQTYEVTLENGYKVYFEYRSHFPIAIRDPSGMLVFALDDFFFEQKPVILDSKVDPRTMFTITR